MLGLQKLLKRNIRCQRLLSFFFLQFLIDIIFQFVGLGRNADSDLERKPKVDKKLRNHNHERGRERINASA